MEKENKKIDSFVHLHLHSSYSFTDGYGLPEQYIKRCVEIGQPGIAVTDHGNISSHLKWYKQCNKAGLKPILGCEMYIVEDNDHLKERSYFHVTLLVKNAVGYTNLTKLVTKSWCEQFYYKPRITFQDLFEHQEGLIVLSGCSTSPIIKSIKDNNVKRAEEWMSLFAENIDDYYFEIHPISIPELNVAYKKFLEIYKEKWKDKIKLVAANDCHYVLKEQNKVQEILLCIQSRDTIKNPNHWKFDQTDFYLKTRQEMEESLSACFPDYDWTEALDNTVEIMNKVSFEFPKAKPISFPMEEKEKIDFLYKICNEGMIKRGLYPEKRSLLEIKREYKERLEYEIDLIVKKNFVDYFLVIWDLVNWTKNKGILVGPARGSAAGSLACYALAITEVEPIKYGLIFERFIDLNREDLPDIDLDFEDRRREEVKKYLEDKYGKDKVGNLPVFAAFKGKSALDDVGRVFQLPFTVIDGVKKAVIERSGGDSRASFTLEDTFRSDVFDYPKKAIAQYPELHYAVDLEGQYRQIGQHAAGTVISNTPLTDFCAIYKIKDKQVISMDYKDASDTGLLKIDLLGLNTLSVISLALESIKKRHKKTIDIYNLPLDDPKVYQGFIDEKLFGIFQFDGQAVNQICRQIKPRDFESLSAISALARPGPLNSGSTTLYIQRRAKKMPVEYSHPCMKPFTEETYGIVVYQEQVMKTMREVGKMSWKDTSEIRKLISRSQGVEKFNTFKEKFSIGAKENGMSNEQIDKIWDSICTFGSWAFNKCIFGDAEIINTNPNQFAPEQITIKELYENKGYATSRWREQPKAYKKMNTLSMDNDGMIRPGRIKDVFYKGKKETIEIKTKSGKTIRVTLNHKMLSKTGFKIAEKFKIGEKIAVNNGYWDRVYESVNSKGKGCLKGLKKKKNGTFLDGQSKEISDFKKEKSGQPCEHCEHFHSRMEVHHVTRTPPNSILEWLCPSCHKKAEYKKGRIKIWQKGFEIGYEKIISIKKHKPEDVYDIEMEDSSRPTFIANGFVSHNSHSVSYTIISYWTMYLKIYYPLEFYSAIMELTASEDKKKKILKEYKKENFKILPIDINKSAKGFSIGENGLRIGFKDIKGIGDITSNTIVKNQPYLSYSDFEHKTRKHKISETIKQNLVNLGAFDSLALNPLQRNLFGDYTLEYTKKELNFSDRFILCPWDMDFGLDKNWMPFIKKNFKNLPVPISQLKEMESVEDVIIYGVIYDKNLRDAREVSMSKGKNFDINKYKIAKLVTEELKSYFHSEYVGRWMIEKYSKERRILKESEDYIVEEQYQFANFVIEDDNDFITVRLSHIVFPSYGKLVFEGLKPEDPVIIKGRMGSGIRLFFANKVISLKDYKQKLDAKSQ